MARLYHDWRAGYGKIGAELSTSKEPMSKRLVAATSRPVEMTNAALFTFMVGAFSILIGLGQSGEAAVVYNTAMLFNVIAVGLGVLDFIFGIGALALKPWAWRLGLIVQAASLINVLVVWGFIGFTLNRLPIIVFSVIVGWYLLRPKIRDAFQPKT